MGSVLPGTEDLLRQHDKVDSPSLRVRLSRFGGYSLDIEVFDYLLTRDFPEFLATQQGLLIRILQIVEASGTLIAFPSQTVYFANPPRNEPGASGEAASADG